MPKSSLPFAARFTGLRRHLGRRASGATLIEYALILGLVALVALVPVGLLGGKIRDIYGKTSNSVAIGDSNNAGGGSGDGGNGGGGNGGEQPGALPNVSLSASGTSIAFGENVP
jgi:Flp pilus assembly pilin Flp